MMKGCMGQKVEVQCPRERPGLNYGQHRKWAIIRPKWTAVV